MSWQATNYVKNLAECPDGARLNPRQKCLLFVLADYHNTAHRAVWPSIASLAEESLQSKRQVYRDLAYFERHRLLVRSNRGGGQGVTVAYEFPELDSPPALKGASLSPFSVGPKGDKRMTKGCQGGAPNKEKTEPEPETPSPPAPPPWPGGGARAPTKRELREIERRQGAAVGASAWRWCAGCGASFLPDPPGNPLCPECSTKANPAKEAGSSDEMPGLR